MSDFPSYRTIVRRGTRHVNTIQVLRRRMKQYDVSLVGFGNVGRAFARLVAESNDSFAAELGFRLNLVAVTDLHFGSVISASGIDARLLSETPAEEGAFAKWPDGSANAQNERVIGEVPADIVIEATYTN